MSTTKPPTVLTLAVCLFPGVTPLDYQGSIELFSGIHPSSLADERIQRMFARHIDTHTPPPFAIKPTFLAYTLDPLRGSSGPLLVADRTYDDVPASEQFDIILIPGGPGARPEAVLPPLNNFIKRQAPGVKYILTVCTGSWILARAGILRGKRATSNKAVFKEIRESTKDFGITWVPTARWVVDGNIWTSSGVTAGLDLANAFLEHLVGKEFAEVLRGVVELTPRSEGDDPFAAYWGLIE